MALIACPECGNSISTTSKTCPQCGAKWERLIKPDNGPSWNTRQNLLAIGLVIVFFLGLWAYFESTGF